MGAGSPRTGSAPTFPGLPAAPGDGLASRGRSLGALDLLEASELQAVVDDCFDLLRTRALVYSPEGQPLLSRFGSSWCRQLDAASSAARGAGEDDPGGAARQWSCREWCWRRSNKRALETGHAVDVQCRGGVRIYALPVVAEGEVVGALSLTYGSPPQDPASLQRISRRFGVDQALLQAAARERSAPGHELIALAQRRLRTSARMLGAMVEHRQTEAQLRERLKELRCLHAVSRVLTQDDVSIDQVLRQVVEIIPSSLRWPHLGEARLSHGEAVVATPGFDEVIDSMGTDMMVGADCVGALEVGYRGPLPQDDGLDPFLVEERDLLTTLSQRIGDAIDRIRGRTYRDALATCSPVAIFSLDLSYLVTSWNAAAERDWGWSERETLGRTPPLFIPASETVLAELFTRVVAGESVPPTDVVAVHKDGTERPASLSLAPLVDGSGQVSGAVIAVSDLTESRRKDAELAKLERRLRTAEKLETVGQLAGGVAHDFNNLLTVINSFAQLAISQLDRADPLRTDLEEIQDAGLRATALTRQLLAFSRRQVLEPTVLDLNAVIRRLSRMLTRLLGEGVTLETDLARDLPPVRADPTQLEQVVMNLAINGRDAMAAGGVLRIATCSRQHHGKRSQLRDLVVRGPFVRMSITDTGSGIPAENQERIFEPFFTTKEPGQGTGMGLATVYGIVKQSGGHVAVDSKLGRGTTFHVYLPAVSAELAPGPEPEPAPLVQGLLHPGDETILLVEDELPVLRLAARVLRGAGYTVHEARNGGEALLLAELHRGELSLLLTDLVMPKLSGPQLAGRLTRQIPGISVLFMSGYAHGVLDAPDPELPTGRILAKPFRPQQLLEAVRSVLDARARAAVAVP